MFRGDRLKEVRELRNLSQRELASRCQIGDKQIWRYENGESNPTADHITAIAKELDISADYLLGLTDTAYIHFTEDELTPMERKLLVAVRQRRIVEAFQTLAGISESDNQSGIAPVK